MSKEDRGPLTDLLKKAISLGADTALSTEDMVKSVVQNLKESKGEITNSVKQELKKLVSQIELTDEIEKILANYTFKIDAEVNFVKKDEAKTNSKKKPGRSKKTSQSKS